MKTPEERAFEKFLELHEGYTTSTRKEMKDKFNRECALFVDEALKAEREETDKKIEYFLELCGRQSKDWICLDNIKGMVKEAFKGTEKSKGFLVSPKRDER